MFYRISKCRLFNTHLPQVTDKLFPVLFFLLLSVIFALSVRFNKVCSLYQLKPYLSSSGYQVGSFPKLSTFSCRLHTFSKIYRGWKNVTNLKIINQLAEYNTIEIPLQKAAVEIQLVKKHLGVLFSTY